MICLYIIHADKFMKTVQPQHLKNLEQDIQWLKKIIQARYDFIKAGTTQQIDYEPVRFRVKEPDSKRVFRVVHLATSQSASKREIVIPIYQDNLTDLITATQDTQKYFVVLKTSATIQLESINVADDWVKVNVPDNDTAYLIDQDLVVKGTNKTNLQGWVKLSDTNVPVSYHPDITTEEFAKVEDDFSSELQELIRPNIILRQEYLQWVNFYANQDIFALPAPALDNKNSTYGAFIKEKKLTSADRLLLILLLLPHLQPGKLDILLDDKFSPLDIGNTDSEDYPGIAPNGLMFIFLQAGHHLEKRLAVIDFMMKDSILLKNNIVQMEQDAPGSPLMSGRLRLHPDYVKLFTLNQK